MPTTVALKTLGFTPKNPTGHQLVILRGWMWLAVAALAAAGLLSVLLVATRTPFVQQFFPLDWFQTALVVHVNLSVLVWMLSCTCILWKLYQQKSSPTLDYICLIGAWFATLCIALSPFHQGGAAYLNNYVPMFEDGWFIFGIGLFQLCILCQAAEFTITHLRPPSRRSAEWLAVSSSAWITLSAMICLILSFFAITGEAYKQLFTPQDFYEHLFWASGHVLQFVYAHALLVAWLMLGAAIGMRVLSGSGLLLLAFGISCVIAIPSPLLFAFHDIVDPEFIQFFTMQMRHGGGIAVTLIGFVIVLAILKHMFKSTTLHEKLLRNCLIASFILFASGGVIGFMIEEINVMIPAHYHGAIVGITLAFMGLCYYLLPRLGYEKINSRAAVWQPVIYGLGQFLHIFGLAWSGGYGVLRKTPGLAETAKGQISMGLMGFGGLLAVIGGFMFVYWMVRVLFQLHKKPKG